MLRLLDTNQLSEMLNVKKKTIYDWVHRGIIPYVKLGHLLRFDPKDIEKWFERKKHRKRPILQSY